MIENIRNKLNHFLEIFIQYITFEITIYHTKLDRSNKNIQPPPQNWMPVQTVPVVVGMEPATPGQLIHFLNYVCYQENDGQLGADLTVRELISGQMDGVYFPINLNQFAARVYFRNLNEQTMLKQRCDLLDG